MKLKFRGLLGHGTSLVLFATLSVFILVLTATEVQRHRKYQEFEADRLGEELLRSIRDGLVSETGELPERVSGIGIYSPGGYPFILLGSVPSFLDPGVYVPGPILYWIDGEDGSNFMVKPLAPPSSRSSEALRTAPSDRLTGYLVVHILDPQGRNYPFVLWLLYAFGQVVIFLGTFLVWQLQNRYGKLAEKLRLREESDFLGDVGSVLAHEIKTPLSTILLQARFVAGHGETKEEGELIAQEALRITELVERVRDLVRDPRGMQETLELTSILRGPGYEALSLDLPEIPVKIRMDILRFRSVLGNLIQNAWESQESIAPSPALKLEVLGNRVRLEVLDRGTGVPVEQRHRLFVPFHTTKSSGTGLGLALSRRFMEGAGGTITLENRTGGGLTARLEWPEAP